MTVHAGIAGSSGRMGRMLVQMISERDDIAVASASEHPSSDAIGRDAGEVAGTGTLGVTIVDSAEALFSSCDVVIDFSSPAATVANARVAATTGKGLVAGTTGLDASARAVIAEASRTAAIVSAGNMSLGGQPSPRHHPEGRSGTRRGVRYRSGRDPSPPQGGRALGNGTDAGRGRREGTRRHPRRGRRPGTGRYHRSAPARRHRHGRHAGRRRRRRAPGDVPCPRRAHRDRSPGQ